MNAVGARAEPRDEAAWQAVLRFAAGITAAFVVSEMMQWTPTFLGPVLAAVFSPTCPRDRR